VSNAAARPTGGPHTSQPSELSRESVCRLLFAVCPAVLNAPQVVRHGTMLWLDFWNPLLASTTFVGHDSVWGLLGINKQEYWVSGRRCWQGGGGAQNPTGCPHTLSHVFNSCVSTHMCMYLSTASVDTQPSGEPNSRRGSSNAPPVRYADSWLLCVASW
jgi:hypothetical protein